LTANVIKDKTEYVNKGMDDAISTPLSVAAIHHVITHFCFQQEVQPECQPPVATELSTFDSSQYDEMLDLDMLNSYIDIVGTKPVLDSIKMFEEMMPEYINILDSNITAKDKKGIVSEAHKIKGAAGSVGLKYIQGVAQKAQTPDFPAWSENIDDWVGKIKSEYKNNIAILKQWLAEKESK
jgi:two-component system aerobic respiration control sensor histidine kinase ArcB